MAIDLVTSEAIEVINPTGRHGCRKEISAKPHLPIRLVKEKAYENNHIGIAKSSDAGDANQLFHPWEHAVALA